MGLPKAVSKIESRLAVIETRDSFYDEKFKELTASSKKVEEQLIFINEKLLDKIEGTCDSCEPNEKIMAHLEEHKNSYNRSLAFFAAVLLFFVTSVMDIWFFGRRAINFMGELI